MAELNWKYAQNQFLRATDGRRPLMLVIGADHTAKLAAKLGSPADPDIQACIDRAQPAFDDFQLEMVMFDVVSGTRKGQTEVLLDLLDELSGQRIKQWDITIQNTFLSGTPQYTQILPNGRGPFQSGARDARILAVQTLGVALAPFPAFTALKTTVETFHTSLQSARNTQQGTEGQIATASAAADDARVALAIALFANVGRLMEKHADDPSRLGDYYEISLLQAGGGTGGTLAAPTGLSLAIGGTSDVIATWNAVVGATSYVVDQLEVGVDPDFTEAGQSSTPDLTFGSYSSGATVQVRVRARDQSGNESPNSTVADVTFP
jgi:hypothetical protein